MQRKKKHFRQASLLLIALIAMAALSACGRDASTPATESTQTADVQAETVQAETEAVTESTSAETGTDTSKTAKDPIKEADMENPEPVQYEGIDLNSTLPAYEWIKTFPLNELGKCTVFDSRKFIIYNDKTNYKVIAENGQRIKFHRGDCLMVYDNFDYGYGEVSYGSADTSFYYSSLDTKYNPDIENPDYWDQLWDNADAVYDEEVGDYVYTLPDSYDIEEDEEIEDWADWDTPESYWGIDNDIWELGEMNIFAAAKSPNRGEWNEERVVYKPDTRWETNVTLVFVE